MPVQLTIAQRLSLGFGLILSLMLLITLIGMQRVAFIDQTLTHVSEGNALKQRYAINFRGSVHDRAISIRDAVLAQDDSALNHHLADIQRLDAFYQDSARAMDKLFAEGAASGQEQRLLAAIQDIERSTLVVTEQLISLRRQGDLAASQALLINQVAAAYSEWLKRINAFIDHEEELISQDLGSVREVAGGFALLILLATAAAVLLSVVVGVVIIRQLKSLLGAEPSQVAEAIHRLAQGDLPAAAGRTAGTRLAGGAGLPGVVLPAQ